MNKLKSTILFSTLLVVMLVCVNQANAQFDPKTNNTKMLTVGAGISGWGVPLFVRFEAPVANFITVGGNLSYQSHTKTLTSFTSNKVTAIGINGRGSYHFNDVFGASNDWDFYAGASLGLYIWKSENLFYSDPLLPPSVVEFSENRLGVAGHAGARYLINEKIALNLELGGGNLLAGGTIGVTFLL